MPVVVLCMRTDEILVPRLINLSVTCDIIVISCEAETGVVAGDERRDRKRLVATGATAVDDNKVDISHMSYRTTPYSSV